MQSVTTVSSKVVIGYWVSKLTDCPWPCDLKTNGDHLFLRDQVLLLSNKGGQKTFCINISSLTSSFEYRTWKSLGNIYYKRTSTVQSLKNLKQRDQKTFCTNNSSTSLTFSFDYVTWKSFSMVNLLFKGKYFFSLFSTIKKRGQKIFEQRPALTFDHM